VTLFLLTNDDGIDSEGLRALEESLQGLGEIVIVAPDRERSAVSHGLTIHESLAVEKIAPHKHVVNGTPADCVIYALNHVCKVRPDLVISGINRGANLADDIMYSGTVAAAREASRHGIPALAVSQAYSDSAISFSRGSEFARNLARVMIEHRSNGGVCLNVNIPVGSIRGVRITRQGCSPHFPHFNALDGKEHLTALSQEHSRTSKYPLDYQAILESFVSITPLQRDQTDYTTLGSLMKIGGLFKV
jgi:5'-nucleotidase